MIPLTDLSQILNDELGRTSYRFLAWFENSKWRLQANLGSQASTLYNIYIYETLVEGPGVAREKNVKFFFSL